MSVHNNVHAFRDNAAGREGAALLNQALTFSREASMADRAGNLTEAVQLHLRALELKVRLFSERSTQAALSYNELGECYLRLNNLPAAEEALTNALRARDDRGYGGLQLGPRYVYFALRSCCDLRCEGSAS